jgi:hypothetical protein
MHPIKVVILSEAKHLLFAGGNHTFEQIEPLPGFFIPTQSRLPLLLW